MLWLRWRQCRCVEYARKPPVARGLRLAALLASLRSAFVLTSPRTVERPAPFEVHPNSPRPPQPIALLATLRYSSLAQCRRLAARPLRGSQPSRSARRCGPPGVSALENHRVGLEGADRSTVLTKQAMTSEARQVPEETSGHRSERSERGASFERRVASFVITRGLRPLGRQRVARVTRAKRV